ncbi:MAG: hypothetical protein V2I43_22045 [Parvularcula sp.]|jgi:hypothetical protein|nr:hypothetical protein [Parvularcula sp.]
MRILAGAFISIALAGCTTVVSETVEGPYYTQGFTDGCRTAEARRAAFDTRSYRDEALFETQESYRGGWRAGYAECQRETIDADKPTLEGELNTRF